MNVSSRTGIRFDVREGFNMNGLTASICFPKLFISNAALLPSIARFPAIKPDLNARSLLPETSRPTGDIDVSVVLLARSIDAPDSGAVPFWPKK